MNTKYINWVLGAILIIAIIILVTRPSAQKTTQQPVETPQTSHMDAPRDVIATEQSFTSGSYDLESASGTLSIKQVTHQIEIETGSLSVSSDGTLESGSLTLDLSSVPDFPQKGALNMIALLPNSIDHAHTVNGQLVLGDQSGSLVAGVPFIETGDTITMQGPMHIQLATYGLGDTSAILDVQTTFSR